MQLSSKTDTDTTDTAPRTPNVFIHMILCKVPLFSIGEISDLNFLLEE